MTKNYSLFYRYYLLFLLFLLLPMGCSVIPPSAAQETVTSTYRSELADPEAKALYAYVEFRLLAIDNRLDEAIAALRRAVVFDPETEFLRMTLAKALLHQDQTDESIKILQQILLRAPENIEGHELLGDLLGYQGNDEAAIGHYHHALQVDPESEMLRLRLAMAYGRLGRNDEAISLLETLVVKQPDAKLAQLSLARFYLENKQIEKAIATFKNLLTRHPDQQQALLEYGRLLEQQQLFAEAFTLYRQGITQDPRAVAIRQQLALLYLRKNRKAEALDQFLSVRQLLPENPHVVGRIGLLRLDMEDWAAAEADFRQLLQLGENEGRNRYYLGLALLGQQQYEEALEVMSPIAETSPVFAEAVMQLAYLYRRAGLFDQAINALQRVLGQDIKKPEIYYYLTTFYVDNGQLNQAADTVALGLTNFPDNVELLYQSAVLCEKRGDRLNALQLMEQILTIDADFAEALNFIAYHHAEKGSDLTLALTRVKKALLTKKTGYIIDTLGWVYFKMGRYQESREQLEEATTLLPDDPVILEHLGDLYRALTLWGKAAAAYEKALGLDPAAEGVADKIRNLPARHIP